MLLTLLSDFSTCKSVNEIFNLNMVIEFSPKLGQKW